MKILLIYTFSIILLAIGGCSKDKIPGVYRIDIQQGNDITQKMINQLKPGMTKRQVSYVMGTPLLIDTFHPDRWDYLYSFHPGNGKREQRRITLYFEQDVLTHIEGDTRIVAREDLPKIESNEKNVQVPLSEQKTGLFGGLKSTLGLGEEQQEIIDVEKQSEQDINKPEPEPEPEPASE